MTYLWKCNHCGLTYEVDRPMGQHNVTPDAAESTGWCLMANEWERIITAPSIKTGDGFKV